MLKAKDQQLYDYLNELKVIDQKKLDKVFSLSQSEKISLSSQLLKQDLISDSDLGKVISDILKLPFIDLAHTKIEDKVLKIIPEVVASKNSIIAFSQDKDGLHLATNNPNQYQLVEFVKKKTGLNVKLYYATEKDIDLSLSLYKKEASLAFEEIIQENLELAKQTNGQSEPPIIKIVDTILQYAYQNKASDIHLEPLKEKSLLRFRIDSVLHDIVKFPLELHPQITTRIKVLSSLRTDEHQQAQDGKMVFKTKQEELDLRVSIVPVTNGEKVVMRLLSDQDRQFSLTSLGLANDGLEKVESAYKKPHGMILSTGPTGSGKTTTMYAILKKLNNRDINIVTIEDPVEYDIEGINQIQVNKKTELTFAKGLRSIVRQDPDIILIGEIRDSETANIAVNAAMTGHLVLSTLHTNDAATAFPRLLDLEVEPFLVASSINCIVAQRLVRKICSKCRTSITLDSSKIDLPPSLVKKYFSSGKLRAYYGKGCPVCHQTGYVGRIGLFEVLLVDDEIRQAITTSKDADTIRKIAVKNGMETLAENGMVKVKEGLTTIEEILRVTKE